MFLVPAPVGLVLSLFPLFRVSLVFTVVLVWVVLVLVSPAFIVSLLVFIVRVFWVCLRFVAFLRVLVVSWVC